MSDTSDLLQADSANGAGSADVPTSTSAAPARKRKVAGLPSMVLPELQTLASQLGISGTGRMRKSELIAAIQEHQDGSSRPARSSAGSGRATVPPVEKASAPAAAAVETSSSDSAVACHGASPGAYAASRHSGGRRHGCCRRHDRRRRTRAARSPANARRRRCGDRTGPASRRQR